MSDAEKTALVKVLRSLINSRKDSNIQNLCNDYRETEGRDIPFQRFNYHNLASFLTSTGEFSVWPNQTIVAKASEASEHIHKLVTEQNTKKRRRIAPQRFMASNRPIRKPNVMQQSVYACAFAKMQYRSPVKPPYQRQQNGYTSNYANFNRLLNKVPQKHNYSDQAPLEKERPKYVVTSEGGIQPVNAMARSAVRSISPPIVSSNPSQPIQQLTPTINQTEPVHAAHEKDLRQMLQDRQKLQEERKRIAQDSTESDKHMSATVGGDLRKKLVARKRAVQAPTPAQRTITIDQSVKTENPAVGPNRLQDRLKQNRTIEEPVISQSSVPDLPVLPKASKLINRLQRFNSVPSQVTFSNGAVSEVPKPMPIVAVNSTKQKEVSTTSKVCSQNYRLRSVQGQLSNESNPVPQTHQPLSHSAATRSLQINHRDANDLVKELEKVCESLNYNPPEYKLFSINKTARVKGNVKVNGITYSTYPNDYISISAAKLEAARCALEQLKLASEQPMYEVCMDPDSEVAMKLFDVLKDSPNGIFLRNIPDMFQNTFQLSLPDHWIQIVQFSPQRFSIREAIQGNQIISAITETTDIVDITVQQGPIVTETAVESPNFIGMDKLQLPWSEKYWDLVITNPKSTVEIWGRLIGTEYSDKFDALNVDIEKYMLQEPIKPKRLIVGNIYLSQSMTRVRVDRNMFDEKRSLCYCIDYGYEEWLAMDDIFVCKPQFVKFPAQAICLSMFGLEDFADFVDAKEHLYSTLVRARVIVCDVLSNQNEYEAQGDSEDRTAKVSVGMYDMSSEDDALLNDVIRTKICDSFEPPVLQMDSLTNIVISYVDDEGAVFCQPRKGSLQYVLKLIHHITNYEFNRDAHRISCVEDVIGSSIYKPLYLVQDAETAKWYRATVLQRDGSVYRMFYVDYGMTRLVNGSNIFRLNSLSTALNRYPYQAIKCHLHGFVDFPMASVVANLRGYLNADTPAILRVILKSPTVPVVQIYIRVNDGPLFCINDTIKLEQEIASTPDIVDDLTSSPFFAKKLSNELNETVTKPSVQEAVIGLSKCLAPTENVWFEVHVTWASNPSNFSVRSYRLQPEFNKMMQLLQDTCNFNTSKVHEVQLGEAYACLESDGMWYRVVVKKLLAANGFQLYNCDYGDLFNVNSSDNLKILTPEFRKLPQLAIAAKLYKIQPRNNDWTDDDCKHFVQLTLDKQFASMVNVAYTASDGSVTLDLTLYDVSTERDININGLLLDDGRAVSLK